jgi:hypothetical protein
MGQAQVNVSGDLRGRRRDKVKSGIEGRRSCKKERSWAGIISACNNGAQATSRLQKATLTKFMQAVEAETGFAMANQAPSISYGTVTLDAKSCLSLRAPCPWDLEPCGWAGGWLLAGVPSYCHKAAGFSWCDDTIMAFES